MARMLVIDNYDSFTYNLVQMFMTYKMEILVFRSDRITIDHSEALNPDFILISPGPKDPAHAGISIQLIRAFFQRIPILGVCLGMQCINEAFGGTTIRAPVPMHGKTSRIHHLKTGIYEGIESPFEAARYHSLMIHPKPDSVLVETARSDDGVIMGVSHPKYPLHGVQYHPESFLTRAGEKLVKNFLTLGPPAVFKTAATG